MRTSTLACFFFLTAAALPGQNIVSSMAGTGFPGFTGDGGPAATAQLYSPQSAAVDSSGTIYFSDNVNHRLRKITPDGIIGTIAGNGIQGSSGDGGPALSANLGWVYQVAVRADASKLCFGDYGAYKIRCVDLSTGIIQGYGTGQPTSAGDGGLAENASFYFPRGAAFDSAGNFYLADYAADRIRRVDAITGIVTTFAGGGSGSSIGDGGPATAATLSFPGDLQVSNGSLYIADGGHDRVRKVDLSTGIITTVAGNGSPYYAGDGGPATLTAVVPGGIAIDTAGNLFVSGGGRIRVVDLAGNISTIAGNGNSGWGYDDLPGAQTVFSGPTGIAWDAMRQRLLISDSDRIRQIFFTPPTSTSLNVSPASAILGQSVTLNAAVSPAAATGSVRFHNIYNLLGASALTQGAASFSFTPSGAGTYYITAVYGGDVNYNLSASSSFTLTVRTQSSTAMTASPNPVSFGSAVTLTAAVKPAAASGSVQFYSGTSLLGSAAIASGQAQLTVTNLPAGIDSLTAVYSGDSLNTGSTSAPILETVKALTTTTLTSSPNPVTFPAAVTLTAKVSPAASTGYVQFFSGALSLGSVALNGGQAQLSVAGLAAGANSLTAVYGGDGSYTGSTSAAVSETVNKANSSTSLAAGPAPQSNSGQPVTFTAKVTPAAASGTVQFLDGATVLGAAPLSGGTAVFSTTSLATGNHTIKASYAGDSNVNGSQSSTLTYRVKH